MDRRLELLERKFEVDPDNQEVLIRLAMASLQIDTNEEFSTKLTIEADSLKSTYQIRHYETFLLVFFRQREIERIRLGSMREHFGQYRVQVIPFVPNYNQYFSSKLTTFTEEAPYKYFSCHKKDCVYFLKRGFDHWFVDLTKKELLYKVCNDYRHDYNLYDYVLDNAISGDCPKCAKKYLKPERETPWSNLFPKFYDPIYPIEKFTES